MRVGPAVLIESTNPGTPLGHRSEALKRRSFFKAERKGRLLVVGRSERRSDVHARDQRLLGRMGRELRGIATGAKEGISQALAEAKFIAKDLKESPVVQGLLGFFRK